METSEKWRIFVQERQRRYAGEVIVPMEFEERGTPAARRLRASVAQMQYLLTPSPLHTVSVTRVCLSGTVKSAIRTFFFPVTLFQIRNRGGAH